MNYSKQLEILRRHIPIDNTKGIFVAGGALTSIFTKTEINDVDMYFQTKDDFAAVLETLVDAGYFVTFLSNKAVTLVKGNETVQLIYYKYFNSVEDIFNEFDFSINMAAFDGNTNEIILHENFLTSLASRTIEFNENTPYPIISAYRTKKYQERGYSFSTHSYIKLGLAISKLNITSWEEFENQVGGIYGDINLKQFEQDVPEFNLDYAIENLDKLVDVSKGNETVYREDILEKTGVVIDDWRIVTRKDNNMFSLPF